MRHVDIWIGPVRVIACKNLILIFPVIVRTPDEGGNDEKTKLSSENLSYCTIHLHGCFSESDGGLTAGV